jgi:hypothetical protein
MDGWRSMKEKKLKGGVAVLVGLIDSSSLNIRLCKIGDCSLFVTRENHGQFEIVFQALDHEKAFNTPFMLAHNCPDGVEQSRSQFFSLQKGDIVFACSDGFVDNVK